MGMTCEGRGNLDNTHARAHTHTREQFDALNGVYRLHGIEPSRRPSGVQSGVGSAVRRCVRSWVHTDATQEAGPYSEPSGGIVSDCSHDGILFESP